MPKNVMSQWFAPDVEAPILGGFGNAIVAYTYLPDSHFDSPKNFRVFSAAISPPSAAISNAGSAGMVYGRPKWKSYLHLAMRSRKRC